MRRSQRDRTKQWKDARYGYDGDSASGYHVASYCGMLAKSLLSCDSKREYDYRYVMALLTDIDYGTTEGMHPMMGDCPGAFKASKTKDPDSPNYTEAVYGEYSAEFQQAMIDEITALEKYKTWTVVKKTQVPEGANVLHGTWAFRIKRLPDGTLRKHKARFCARGDKQIAGVDYFDKYAPVVQWSTVRMMLCIAASE